MSNKLYVSSSPHLRGHDTTQKIMLNVIIALIPSVIASCYIFGFRSFIVISATVLSCVVSEYAARRIMKRENTVPDLSAVVTGILLAFNLPVGIDIWMAVLGGVIAIVVVKQMFGGIGQNFVNPALAARIILMSSFPNAMTTWAKAFYYKQGAVDAVTSATPLAVVRYGGKPPAYFDMLLGFHGGCLGETCAVALVLGGMYLVAQGVIKPTIPIIYVGTVFVLTWALGCDPVFEILAGGLLLGAIFMATDYATTPMTFKGKVIFALGCGLITVVIRLYGSLPEGVSFSIIIMNILTPIIDRATKPKPFGYVTQGKIQS